MEEICGIQIVIDVMVYFDGYNRRQKADVVLKKGEHLYACECVDIHNWDRLFCAITLNNAKYLCFRKTLYGFTLLNADTLVEEYDYFPEKVINKEESFIFGDAASLGNILIFDGCYWADAYVYFAYDCSQKLFLNLSDEFCVYAGNGGIHAEEDKLILTGENEASDYAEVTITREELSCLLKEKGVPDC